MPRHEACNFIKKETLTPQVFFVNFAKFLTAPFLQTTFRWLLLTPTLVFFCEYYEIFKNTCFEKHLRTTAYWFLHKQYFTHTLQKQPPEVKISQNSQENTYARVNFIKKAALAQVCSYEFCEISKNTCFTEHLRTTASNFSWDTSCPIWIAKWFDKTYNTMVKCYLFTSNPWIPVDFAIFIISMLTL